MLLDHLSIINYRNLQQVELDLSPKLNCFFGQNGQGKTNLLDALYYLSFCKSASNPSDSQNILHDQDFFMLQGTYHRDSGIKEEVYCALKRQKKKVFKRNQKEYQRFSQHIGLFPLVMVSPDDSVLIQGVGEERRRFMDQVISQYDPAYLDALIRYNKALEQRNTMLKRQDGVDEELFLITEQLLADFAHKVSATRQRFLEEFIPSFQEIHSAISQHREPVSLNLKTHCLDACQLLETLQKSREKERIIGYTLHGAHRDDLEMLLGGYPIRREGSQGQNKTFLVSLKLSQFMFLSKKSKEVPLLLLDDIFDKLDSGRVEQIIRLVGSERFGQIFITDTNRENLDRILSRCGSEYRLFNVEDGKVRPLNPEQPRL